MKACALFIDADPLNRTEIFMMNTLNDLNGKVDVFLERKSQSGNSLLSYDEKVKIIEHDVPHSKCNYQIHPVDTTKIDALRKNKISYLAVPVSSKTNITDLSERLMLLGQMLKSCQTILIPIEPRYDFSSKLIKQMILDDDTRTVCTKTISEYGLSIIRTKLIKKFNIIVPASHLDAVVKVLKDREDQYEIIVADQKMTSGELCSLLAKKIQDVQNKTIAVVSTKKLDECIVSLMDNVVTYGKSNSMSMSGTTDEDISRSLIKILNSSSLKSLNKFELF